MVNHQLVTPLLEFPSNATESAITMIPELNVSVLYSWYHTMAHFYITVVLLVLLFILFSHPIKHAVWLCVKLI